jgi:UDP-N-acetylmuramoylalanine--D-glutamate ligase
MKIAIIGWGVEGQSAFRYFGPEHSYLIVNETPQDDFPPESDSVKVQFIKSEAPVGITGQVQDLSYLNGIEDCDKVIYSVTAAKNLETVFPPDDKFWQKAVTVQHVFFQKVKTKNIIGVTGTKGKGTTSTLITKLLEAAGKKVFLGGNIGISVLDFLDDVQPEDWVVLELSNFQLYKLDSSPHIAVCLMVVEEHMDWHPNMQDYVNAKSNLFKHQVKDDLAIYYAGSEISERLAGYSPGIKIPYFRKPGALVREDGMIVIGDDEQEILHKREIKLLGEHNLQNVCAALTAYWQVHQEVEPAKKVLAGFSGLEHRLEFVRELDGVKYYDDSFGTTPATAVVALKSFPQPVILIAGGHDKGGDYENLALDIVKDRVKHVIAIGAIAERIATALRSRGYNDVTTGLAAMPEIVAKARSLAQPGDVVLLSAGTSSFGMFKDYKDRGNQFKKAVQELKSPVKPNL